MTNKATSFDSIGDKVCTSMELRHEGEMARGCTVCKILHPSSLLSLLLVSPYFGTDQQRRSSLGPYNKAPAIPYNKTMLGKMEIGLHALCPYCYFDALSTIATDQDNPPIIIPVIECDGSYFKMNGGRMWAEFDLSTVVDRRKS